MASVLSATSFKPSTIAAAPSARPSRDAPRELGFYVGTYTGGPSQGIYWSRLDLESGALAAPELAAETSNPSFLALHPNGRFLYAVGESREFAGKPGGAVRAFRLDPDSHRLILLNEASSGGAGPCHLTVDATGRHVLVANYGGGSVTVLALGPDGRLGETTAFVQHHGSSVNRQRQAGPHAHGIYLDAANRLALVPDLGLDQVLLYRFDPQLGTLASADPAAVSLAPGSGPRHLGLHPNGRALYVINELLSTITAFEFLPGSGRLVERQTVSTLPPDFGGNNSTAEICLRPDGRFLYGSNRGHDSIAVYRVDEATGLLTLVQHEPTQGRTPRNFAIDPTGGWLIAANQGSNSLVAFRIDAASGRLTPARHSIEVGSPVCIAFVVSDKVPGSNSG